MLTTNQLLHLKHVIFFQTAKFAQPADFFSISFLVFQTRFAGSFTLFWMDEFVEHAHK